MLKKFVCDGDLRLNYFFRREWCNCNDSVLLFLILDEVIPQIRKTDWGPFRETIQQHLEQVVYCLYAHPNKKPKVCEWFFVSGILLKIITNVFIFLFLQARYLTDHNVSCIPLTWDRGMQLFELFRPDETPSYDSLRINLIGSDTEVLFRRIAALIPDENDPGTLKTTSGFLFLVHKSIKIFLIFFFSTKF